MGRAGKGRDRGDAVGPTVQQPQPDRGVPEAENGPGRRDEEAGEENEVDDRPAARADDRRHRAGERRICRDVEGEHRQAPAAQRRGRLQPGRRRVGGRRRERRGETGVLGHPENPRSCRLSAARLKL